MYEGCCFNLFDNFSERIINLIKKILLEDKFFRCLKMNIIFYNVS